MKVDSMKNRFLLLAALCCCALVAVGCSKGPKLLHITGSVKVADETVEQGMINFTAADGQGSSAGGKITDGVFEADLPAGEYNVTCNGTKVVGEFAPDPLYPDRLAKQYEDFPAVVFTEKITVKIEKKGQVVDINYTGEGNVE